MPHPKILQTVGLLVAICAFSSTSPAQIIYEPIQYQFGQQRYVYYGGSDPAVLARAAMPTWSRRDGYAFVSGNLLTHREVSTEGVRVYTDDFPYQNAAIYGYTIDDARNAAYLNAPRYFTKRDLLASAEPGSDGDWHVPAQPRIAPTSPGLRIWEHHHATTLPATTTQPILRLPKSTETAPGFVKASHSAQNPV